MKCGFYVIKGDKMKYFKSLDPENKFIFANKDGIGLQKEQTWPFKEYYEYKNCITVSLDENDIIIEVTQGDTVWAKRTEEIKMIEFVKIYNNATSNTMQLFLGAI